MLDIDGLWETYFTIKKLAELGQDERGNSWAQGTFGCRYNHEPPEELAGQYNTFVAAGELCGTSQCFAGWYAALKNVHMNGWGNVKVNGVVAEVDFYVMQAAGLEVFEAQRLFSGANSLEDIADILVAITGEDWRK